MSPNEDLTEYTLSVAEVAKILNVQPMTIRRWVGSGRLPARRLPGTKPYKLRQADIDALIHQSKVVTSQAAAQAQSEGMAGIDSVAMLLDPAQADAE